VNTGEGSEEDAWVATHADRPPRTNVIDATSMIPDIEMEDASIQDDEIRDMDIDDIPGLEEMQMPSDDESEDETARKLYTLPHRRNAVANAGI
jgi:hypothetical protein